MAVFPFRTLTQHETRFKRVAYVSTIILIVLSVVLSLWVKTHIMAIGYEVADLQRKILEEESRLGILEARLHQLGSPGQIQTLAKEQGMVYPSADQLEFLLNQSTLRASELADKAR